MTVARELLACDREWGLDHSRRAFRVRCALPDDRPGHPPPQAEHITIVRLRDAASVILLTECAGSTRPVEDSDRFARHRLGLIDRKRLAVGLARAWL